MFNNVALDVFIGLIFVFLLYSLMATILQEIIATRFAFRAKVLEKAILRMLEDGKTTGDVPYMDRIEGILHIFNLKSLMKGKKVAPWFYAHPLIKYLAEDNWYSKPAYITSANFSKVILDLLKGIDQPSSHSLQAIHESLVNKTIHKIDIKKPDMANPAVKRLNDMNELEGVGTVELNDSTAVFLRSLWEDSGADVVVFQAKLEQWFNDTMERTTGWFKKYTRIVLFFIGLGLAYFFNVDSIAIKRILTNNRPAREQMVSIAIANYEKLDPEKVFGKDSSLLDSTYRLVAADAEKANNVLGLGKPWKDTLTMWADSMKSPDFKKRMQALKEKVPSIQASVSQIEVNLDKNNTQLESLGLQKSALEKQSAPGNQDDSIVIAKTTGILKSISHLKDSIEQDKHMLAQISAPLRDYERMDFLKNRSEYIKKTIGDRWFVYAPHQRGDLETVFGWIITALAVMLGAPFWFDLLSKLINLRGTGTRVSTWDSPTPPPVGQVAAANPVSTTTNNNTNTDQEAVG